MSKFTTFKLNNSNQRVHQFVSTSYVTGTSERASQISVYLILATTLWGWHITLTSQRRNNLKHFLKLKDKYRLLNKRIEIVIQVYLTAKPVLLANKLYSCPIPVLHSGLERGPTARSVATGAVCGEGGTLHHTGRVRRRQSLWVWTQGQRPAETSWGPLRRKFTYSRIYKS